MRDKNIYFQYIFNSSIFSMCIIKYEGLIFVHAIQSFLNYELLLNARRIVLNKYFGFYSVIIKVGHG